MALTQINSNAIQTGVVGPKIANVQIANSSWSVLDDTAVDLAGGYVIVNGSGFVSGCSVLINNTPATSVTRVSDTVLRVQVPALSAATYVVYVINPDGGTAIGVNGLTSSGFPAWVTSSTLTNQTKDIAFSIQLSATGATSYSLQGGSSLPAGTTLASNGLFSGTVTGITQETTYSFTVEATDAENQNSPRTFSLSVLTATAPTSVEYLVVAGGGGGGSHFGAGGGAGGLLTGNLSVTTSTSYTVTVGSGGAGGTYSGSLGGNVGGTGSNSEFHTVSTIRGGGGAGRHSSGFQPTPGGSGGGGNSGEGGAQTGAAGVYPGSSYISSTRQGYNGGDGYNSAGNSAGGGGGGAGAAGGNASSLQGGTGGTGVEWPTSSSTYYGGGGGGISGSSGAGSGGTGGGGAGGSNNGAVNTGGGGGGSTSSGTGGSGGSGIVIIRYPDAFLAAVSTTGSPTVTTSGGYRIYKFTGSGSITW